MLHVLWLAGVFGPFWSMDGLPATPSAEPGVVAGNSRVDRRMPIPPALPSDRLTCDEPPSHAEILRALPSMGRGVPDVFEIFRDDIEFTVEKVVDRIDPPRFFPMVGTARLHHCQWKCTVYFTETTMGQYPFPFKTAKRYAEVVHIDKDQLRPCIAEWKPAPALLPVTHACPAGFAKAKESLKPDSTTQVQIELLILEFDRNAMSDEAARRLAEAVALNRGWSTHEFQLLSRPTIRTLSGRSATVQVGSQFPVQQADGTIIYKHVGTSVEVRPTVLPDGKVRLDVRAELTRLVSPRNGAADGFETTHVQTTTEQELGRTICLGGLARKASSAAEWRIPFVSGLPVVGPMLRWKVSGAAPKELIIVATPSLVTPSSEGEASEPPPPPPFPRIVESVKGVNDVFAVWDNSIRTTDDAVNQGAKVRGVTGRLYLFSDDSPADASGTVTVVMYELATKKKIATWELDARSLAKLKKKDRLGDGYTLFLPLEDAKVRHVQLQVTHRAPDGPIHVAAVPLVLQDGNASMTVDDVIRMTQKGVSTRIIQRQIETTNAGFALTVDDIIRLHDNGVSEDVILMMQNRR